MTSVYGTYEPDADLPFMSGNFTEAAQGLEDDSIKRQSIVAMAMGLMAGQQKALENKAQSLSDMFKTGVRVPGSSLAGSLKLNVGAMIRDMDAEGLSTEALKRVFYGIQTKGAKGSYSDSPNRPAPRPRLPGLS